MVERILPRNTAHRASVSRGRYTPRLQREPRGPLELRGGGRTHRRVILRALRTRALAAWLAAERGRLDSLDAGMGDLPWLMSASPADYVPRDDLDDAERGIVARVTETAAMHGVTLMDLLEEMQNKSDQSDQSDQELGGPDPEQLQARAWEAQAALDAAMAAFAALTRLLLAVAALLGLAGAPKAPASTPASHRSGAPPGGARRRRHRQAALCAKRSSRKEAARDGCLLPLLCGAAPA